MRSIATVLVVVLLVVVCSGLAVVGVGRVREAAARAQCMNNLKQIGIALHNYASAYNSCFPEAGDPNPNLPPERRLSWLVTLVPYIEANDLYSKMEHQKGWDAEENRFAALTRWKTFQCPAYPEQAPVSTLIPSHYVGVAGLGDDAAMLPAGHLRAGFFGHDRKLVLTDIEKHAGSLMAAIETAQAHGAWTAAGSPTVRGVDADADSYLGPGRPFGGNHPNAAVVLFADASVRILNESIDPRLFEAMATIKGAKSLEPIGDE